MNYQENNIAGNMWKRSPRIEIFNGYKQIPSIKFYEEEVLELENNQDKIIPCSTTLTKNFRASDNITLLDPATGAATGTISMQVLQHILYSLYIQLAKERDIARARGL